MLFVPAEKVHGIDFSAFFQQVDKFCGESSEKGEESAKTTKKGGLDIFSEEKKGYDEKMDAMFS